MDGLESFPNGTCLVIAAALIVGACAEFDPEPDPVPISMYDSPVVANGISDDSTANRKKAPAKREETDDETRTAEADDESNGSESSPRPEADPSGPPAADSTSSEPTEPSLASRRDAPSDTSDDGPPPLASREHASTDTGATTASDASGAPERDANESPDEARAERSKPTDTAADGGADRPTSSQSDAAGYVAAIYELNEVSFPAEARSDIANMYRHCRDNDAVFQTRAPNAGDLVFFHNVRDANDDGRNNDWYTWVGLVERVDSDGTVHVLGYRDGAVRSASLNLNRPDTRKDGGDLVNTRLRQKRKDDPPYTQYLAGQLFAGYCSLLGDRSELLVVDNWQPGMELSPPE